jgi:hypothetical protein
MEYKVKQVFGAKNVERDIKAQTDVELRKKK